MGFAQPDKRSRKDRANDATALLVRITVHLIEEGDQVLSGVEGSLRGLFDLGPHVDPGGRTLPRREGVNGALDQRPSLLASMQWAAASAYPRRQCRRSRLRAEWSGPLRVDRVRR